MPTLDNIVDFYKTEDVNMTKLEYISLRVFEIVN